MPPVRTMPPAKALKTERTHEENQERAYIAASRRSDRSLEARVESARRASEIHKRRTGRSLRVTEQDVINEEMYEEEDDDLPMQYRRLTAHLQTGSVDFNRRLHAYLTNQVAMRSALDQAITNSYAQQYPNAPQFAHNQNTYPSPFMPQNFSQPPQQQHSPTSYQPYPSPGSASYRPGHHVRTMSDSVGNQTFSPTGMSAPSPTRSNAGTGPRRTSGSSNKSSSHSPVDIKSTPSMQPRSVTDKPSPPSSNQQDINASQRKSSHQSSPPLQYVTGLPSSSMSPFSTSLSTEAQMLLGNTLDPRDPMTAMMMAGSENLPQPWNYNNNSSMSMKPRNGFSQSLDGMSATLAPSALDMSNNSPHFSNGPSSMSLPASANPDGSHMNAFDSSMNDFSKNQLLGGNSSGGSGVVTPSIDGGWDAFINENSWSDGHIT